MSIVRKTLLLLLSAGLLSASISPIALCLEKLALEGNEKILDVGCSDGKITAEIAHALPRGYVVGVDISPAVIQTAKAAFADRKNAHFVVRDATALNYVNQFDVITSFRVMHWISDQDKALRSMYNALKDGGRACIMLPMALHEPLSQAVQQTMSQPAWRSYFVGFTPPSHYFQPEEYRALVLKAKFKPARIEVVTKEEYFANREDFRDFLLSWLPCIRPLPKDKKELFLSEVIDRYLEVVELSPQGKIYMREDRLEVEAVKN